MPPTCDYFLRFKPIFRRFLWGGRRLEAMLGKSLPPGNDYAESWEIVDHGADQSVVTNGPLTGKTLADLARQFGENLLGRHASESHNRFPLLLKFLDCNRTLSVQVHPNDEQASHLSPPDLGKTEAWVVLAAEPRSKIYAGLKPGVTRAQLADAVAKGRCDELLHQFEPGVGDCVFIPAGTVHALGAGLVIAEIQQASDTTFRLFDWNRVDAEGKPRALHVEKSLEVIDYDRGPVSPVQPLPTDEPGRERLIECDKFLLDRVTLHGSKTVGGDGRFHILACVQGSLCVEDRAQDGMLALGDTGLLPAASGRTGLASAAPSVVLDICLP
jgi:mannose-6-phosphate isomerase